MRIEDQLALESQRNENRRDWTIVSLVAVAIAAITIGRSSLEIELIERSHAALTQAGAPTAPLDIRFVGRTGVLSGRLHDQSTWDLVVDTVALAPGVQRVDASALVVAAETSGNGAGTPPRAETYVRLGWDGGRQGSVTVAEWRLPSQPGQPTPSDVSDGGPSPMDPVLVAEIDNGVLTLTGLLPNDPAVTQMVSAAAESFGSINVKNRIQTSPEIQPAEWLHKVPVILAQAREIEHIVLFFADEGIGMSDASEEDIARMEAARDVTRQLSAPEPVAAAATSAATETTEPSAGTDTERSAGPDTEPFAGTGTEHLRLRVGADGILLTGTLTDAAQAEQIADAVAAALSRPVTDQIAIDPSAASPPWLGQLDQAWRILAQVDALAVDVVGQDVILGGQVPSEQDRQVVVSAARTILAPANVVDRLDVVDWAAKAKALAKELTHRLGYELTFIDSQADLTSASRILLQQVALALEANPRARLGIGVHTDNRGTPESNRALTQGRADRVRGYLVELGIAPERLVAVGFGDTRPIADNTTREGRAQNRRIDFFVPAGE